MEWLYVCVCALKKRADDMNKNKYVNAGASTHKHKTTSTLFAWTNIDIKQNEQTNQMHNLRHLATEKTIICMSGEQWRNVTEFLYALYRTTE